MSSADPIQGVLAKTDRAKEHGEALTAEIQEFFKRPSYRLEQHQDAETGEWKVIVRIHSEPSPRASAIIGDFVHNLRSALDLLVWQLVVANGGRPDNRHTFPIADSEAAFPELHRDRLRGVSDEAARLVAELRPYPGGNDDLWRLHKLDIIHKHRLLVTVASTNESVELDFTPEIFRVGREAGMFKVDEEIPRMPIRLRPADRRVSDGSVVLSSRMPLSPEELRARFEFALSLDEPEITRLEPISRTLPRIERAVEAVVNWFRPLLEPTGR